MTPADPGRTAAPGPVCAPRTRSDVVGSVPIDPLRPPVQTGPAGAVRGPRDPARRRPTTLTAQGHAQPATGDERIGCGQA